MDYVELQLDLSYYYARLSHLFDYPCNIIYIKSCLNYLTCVYFLISFLWHNFSHYLNFIEREIMHLQMKLVQEDFVKFYNH